MNKLEKLLNLGFLLTIVIISCRKVEPVPFQTIDLGKQSTSTSIKSITQNGNTITAEFATTAGSKYSVQIIPFGSEDPAKKEGFTAKDTLTVKSYDLTGLAKKHYDFIFIDISGKEVKFPIVIK